MGFHFNLFILSKLGWELLDITLYSLYTDQLQDKYSDKYPLYFSMTTCWFLKHSSTFFLFLYKNVQSNLNSSNTDGSFTMANLNSDLSPYEILPIDQENKYLRKLSYFIMKLYVVCTH